MERADFVEALRRLDPSRPAEDAQIVARPGWDRFDEVLLQVQAGTRPRYILMGSVGVGKTTELQSWKSRFEQEGITAHFEVVEPGREWFGVVGAGILLVDGLDLQPVRADEWFGVGGKLAEPSLPAMVLVAPYQVSRWPVDRRDSRLTPLHLPPFPVLGRDGHPHAPGLRAMVELLSRRIAPGTVENPGLVARVALMSGGVPRDAVRILRAAVLSAARGLRPVALRDVVAGERELRQDFEQAFVRDRSAQAPASSDDYGVLRVVLELKRFTEPDPRLLTMGAVLTWEDEQGQYSLPHPVLFDTIGHRDLLGPTW